MIRLLAVRDLYNFFRVMVEKSSHKKTVKIRIKGAEFKDPKADLTKNKSNTVRISGYKRNVSLKDYRSLNIPYQNKDRLFNLNGARLINEGKKGNYSTQKSLLHFTGKRDIKGNVNLNWYAERIVENHISKAFKKARYNFGFNKEVDVKSLLLISKRDLNIKEIISMKGKLEYAWVGFTYIFKEKGNQYFQAGLSTVAHPKRYNFYIHNIIYHPEKRIFKRRGIPTILGYIYEYLKTTYGMNFFKKADNTFNFDLIKEKIEKKFEFKIVGVFWNDQLMRDSETQLILFGNNLLKSSNQEAFVAKYGLDASLNGRGLNSVKAAGIGGYNSLLLFKRIIYYTAMGYSTLAMYKFIRNSKIYTKSYNSFKTIFYSIFKNIEEARNIFTIPIINQLKNENLPQNEINNLFPLMKSFNKIKFLNLIRKGFEEKDIAQKMGYKISTFINKIYEFFDEDLLYLPSQFRHYKKSNTYSFTDLRYLLLSCSIFQSAFKGLNRNEAVKQFDFNISIAFLKLLCKKMFKSSYSDLKTESIGLLSKTIILHNEIEKDSDYFNQLLSKFKEISKSKTKFYQKAFFAYNLMKTYINQNKIDYEFPSKMKDLKNEHIIKIIELSFKAIIADGLLDCYKYGLGSKDIVKKFKFFKTDEDVEEWSNLLFQKNSSDMIRLLKFSSFDKNLEEKYGIIIPQYKICKFCLERYKVFPYFIDDLY